MQAYSSWLYKVPWGMYKAVTYIKERYGNPTVILSENGMLCLLSLVKHLNTIPTLCQ